MPLFAIAFILDFVEKSVPALQDVWYRGGFIFAHITKPVEEQKLAYLITHFLYHETRYMNLDYSRLVVNVHVDYRKELKNRPYKVYIRDKAEEIYMEDE